MPEFQAEIKIPFEQIHQGGITSISASEAIIQGSGRAFDGLLCLICNSEVSQDELENKFFYIACYAEWAVDKTDIHVVHNRCYKNAKRLFELEGWTWTQHKQKRSKR